jgi:hypothetical protein
MPVSAITGRMPDLTVKAVNSNAAAEQAAKEAATISQVAVKDVQKKPVEANVEISRVVPEKRAEVVRNDEEPVRVMSHVVEEYTQQGKLVIKFVDSKNNTLYQIPPEMVSKMEDQMYRSSKSTDTKG